MGSFRRTRSRGDAWGPLRLCGGIMGSPTFRKTALFALHVGFSRPGGRPASAQDPRRWDSPGIPLGARSVNRRGRAIGRCGRPFRTPFHLPVGT